jgi:hypothetical protein
MGRVNATRANSWQGVSAHAAFFRRRGEVPQRSRKALKMVKRHENAKAGTITWHLNAGFPNMEAIRNIGLTDEAWSQVDNESDAVSPRRAILPKE